MKALILPRQKIESRDIALDIVFDQWQEVPQLNEVGQVVCRTDGAGSIEEIGRLGPVMEPRMAGPLDDR